MKTKPIAAALAALAALPALAQSNVTIYGSANVSFESVRREGATAGAGALNSMVGAPSGENASARNRVTSTNSALGFRGSEDLGNGLKAIFQYETFVNIDGSNNTLLGGLPRNSGVGIAGGFGTVMLGIWDTPYKFVGIPFDSFNVFQANHEVLVGSPGFNVQGTTRTGRQGNATDAAFIRRQGNSLQYWSPDLAGFAARVAYVANEDKGSVNGAGISPEMWSLGLSYTAGPLYLAYGYEQHDDFFGLNGMLAPGLVTAIGAANPSSRDRGHKLVGTYTFGATTLGAIFERLEYENDDGSGSATAIRGYERDAWYLSLQHRIGAGTVRALYGRANDGDCELAGGGSCSTGGLGATHWSLGYSHELSKRTELYAFYTRVGNDRAANYNLASGGAINAGVGSDPQSLALAVRHRF